VTRCASQTGATRRKPAAVDTARALEQMKVRGGLKKRREAALAAQKVSVVEVQIFDPPSGMRMRAQREDSEVIGRRTGIQTQDPGRGIHQGAEASVPQR